MNKKPKPRKVQTWTIREIKRALRTPNSYDQQWVYSLLKEGLRRIKREKARKK